MKRWLGTFSLKSIRFKMVLAVVCILVPLIGLLIYNNFYAVRVIHNQVAESNRNRLIQYMRQIDTNLDILDSHLSTLAAFDTNIQVLSMESDDETRLLSTSELSTMLTKDILAYRNVDCIFVYNTLTDEFIYGKNDTESYAERNAMKDFITKSLHSDPMKHDLIAHNKWFVKKMNNEYYLMRIYPSYNSYVGAWVRVKLLLSSMNYIDIGKSGIALMTTVTGIPMASTTPLMDKQVDLTKSFDSYYLTGENEQYLLVGANSIKGDFHLVMLLEDKTILENLPILNNVITAIAIGSILLLPLSLFLLHRFVLKPLNRVLSAMKRVKNGDIEVRIREYDTSDEFKLVNDTFNSMLDQIHDLKISVYEEQLSKQREELDRLQLQVNPHFFLNSLNIIYRLAQTRKYELIQEMSLCLLQYFRYMFRHSHKLVSIREELEHVHNYVRIQELRFPGNLTCEIIAEDFVLDTWIPPLAIQNFVENSVKYAVTLDEPIHLSVEVKYLNSGVQEVVKIKVQDTGKGFPLDILEELQSGRKIEDGTGERLGVWNVQRRLELLYNGDASIQFYNRQPTGAVVEITLPWKGVTDEQGNDSLEG